MSCDVFRMIMQNQIDDMALSASPAISESLPIDNLKLSWRSRVMRSQPSTKNTNIIQIITGTTLTNRATIADGIALAQHNLIGVDTYRLTLFSGENQTGEITYDSGAIAAAIIIPIGQWVAGVNYFGETYGEDLDKIAVNWFKPVAYRSFKLTLESYNNKAGFIQIGMLYLGKSIQPENNFDWGNTIVWNNSVRFTRTEGGSLITEGSKHSSRELSINLSYMTNADRNLLAPACRKSLGKPILVSAYPLSADLLRRTEYTMIGKLEPSTPWSHTHVNEHQRSLKFMEI